MMNASYDLTPQSPSPKSTTFWNPLDSQLSQTYRLKKKGGRFSLDLSRGNTLDVSQLKSRDPKLPRIEFYKTNIGPGAYNVSSERGNKSPRFSFGKNAKLRLETTVAPGVGAYSPTQIPISKKAPRCIMGKASKWDEYWEKKMIQRSPGPIYGCTLDQDSANRYQLNRAPVLKPGKNKRQLSVIEGINISPSPERYTLKSTFDRKDRGYSFGNNKSPLKESVVMTSSSVQPSHLPGPGTYSPQHIRRKPNLSYSFGKDGRAWQKEKDQYPKLTPLSYSVGKYSRLSGHKEHKGHGFPSAPRHVDFEKVIPFSPLQN